MLSVDFEIKEITAKEEELTESPDFGEIVSVDEALSRCINRIGSVDMHYIAEASGRALPELVEFFGDALIQDPKDYDAQPDPWKHWMLREQYLTGNLMAKLSVAKAMNRKHHCFVKNIAVLEKVLPKCPTIDTIGITLGSPWIPVRIYQQFCKEVLGLSALPFIAYSKTLHEWKVKENEESRKNMANTVAFGTERISALKLVEKSLNAETPKVFDKTYSTKRKLNKAETMAAQEKQILLQKAFAKWLRQDANRVRMLEKIFYETYTCNAAGQYDGSILTLPDLSPEVSLYPHQKSAVAQIIFSKNVLLHHSVGAGKTWDIIIGIHELHRMGLSHKNLVVTPNNVLQDFEKAHRMLYPKDEILVIYPKDFTPAKRRAALEQMGRGAYVAIYMAASSFELIPMSRTYYVTAVNELKNKLWDALVTATMSWEVKAIEAQLRKQEKQLEKLREEIVTEEHFTFESLGITCLAVDEAHNFKNITLDTNSGDVIGMYTIGSRKCDGMMEKVQQVRSAGGRIIFSTGTPLTNSLSDIYVFQRFLQPETLRVMGFETFDEWINTFAIKREAFEIDVDGQHFRTVTRFSKFHNIRELISVFGNVCNVYLGENSGMDLPKCEGYKDILLQRPPELADYMRSLAERTDNIRDRSVSVVEDNFLKVTQDGRSAALDMRLVDKNSAVNMMDTKCHACARNVFDMYRKYPGTAQIIFCDRIESDDFHIYRELKTCLMHMGVPEAEIAFIHDADNEKKRLVLFEKVNRAAVRVLIGSTAKLGMGVNVQERLIAIHHLDIPFRPADMMQREGRLIRHGNRNSEVFRFRYICQGSFDGYSWQILENKVRFISQFMENAVSDEVVDDIAETVLNYAEIKALALGNPLFKTRCEIANALDVAKINQHRRDGELFRLKGIVSDTPKVCKEAREAMEQIALDRLHFEEMRQEMSLTERQAFGEKLLASLREKTYVEKALQIDSIHGFEVWIPAWMDRDKPYILLKGKSGKDYHVNMKKAKALGCLQRIEYVLSHLSDRIERFQEKIKEAGKQRKQALEELKKGNPYDAEVARLILKLSDIDAEF